MAEVQLDEVSAIIAKLRAAALLNQSLTEPARLPLWAYRPLEPELAPPPGWLLMLSVLLLPADGD